MPISIASLQNNTRTLTVEYDGDSVTVVYRPGAITPSSTAEFSALPVTTQLEQLLASWDVTDDKGKPLPVTTELLDSLPGRFLIHLVAAINEDMRPNVKRAVS